MKNSLIISVLATSISLAIAILAATAGAAALSRRGLVRHRGLHLLPGAADAALLPLSQVVNWLGLSDSIWALVVTYPTFLVPFSLGLYFRTVPRGRGVRAGRRRQPRADALRIVLPMAVPARLRGALRLHAVLERVHLRAHVRLAERQQTAVVA